MKKITLYTAVSCVAVLALCACNSSKKVAVLQEGEPATAVTGAKRITRHSAVASPHAIVYRTRGDYSQKVPIIMDKTSTYIVSYPDPVDVRNNPVPTQLDNGFLLDNRGIGKYVAYTSYTYSEYAAMESAPTQTEFIYHIIDKYPLLEMWDCGPRHKYQDLVNDLNRLIADGFPGCKSIIPAREYGTSK